MKSLRQSFRSLTVISTISLLFVAPVLAQQEVSPDRFEAVTSQNGQHATQVQRKSANASAKKQAAKVRHSSSAGGQKASKSAQVYTEMARK